MPANLFIPIFLGGMILTVSPIIRYPLLYFILNVVFRVQATRYGPNGRQGFYQCSVLTCSPIFLRTCNV